MLFGTEDDEEDPEEPKKLENKTFETQEKKMNAFETVTKGKKADLLEKTKSLKRAFFVLESQFTYDLKDTFKDSTPKKIDDKSEPIASAHMILHKVLIGNE